MLFGLMFLAMPLAIVGTHFSEIWFVVARRGQTSACRIACNGVTVRAHRAEKEKVIFLQQLKVLRLPTITHEEMSRIFDDFDQTGDGYVSARLAPRLGTSHQLE